MSKTRKRYPSFTIFLFFLIAILLFYHRAFFGYFQSDEWFYFTQFLPLTRESSGIILALYKSIANSLEVSSGGHLTPIYNIFWFLHNLVFGINYQPYIILSIFFHTINTFLVHLFTLHITKSKTIAIIAGLFFGLSYVHFQAITWVMAYIPTQLSVTFLLLSLIFLIRILKNYSFKGIVLVALFFICSLLSKESAVILFLIIPQIAFFSSSKWVYKKNVFLMTIFVGFLYIPYRFILPLLFHGGDTVKLNLDIGLTFFRIITYPLKMITEVFIPSPLILSLSEYLTPYAYPMYAIDKDVRGTAFLTFTQNAGSDIIIYIFSTLFILLIIYGLIKSYKKREQLLSVSVGVSFIVFSALPLILISIYAPWWGYVTFIDSRHIYLASIGGSVIFSTLINSIMSKIRIKNLNNICLVIIIATWMILQYSLLQQQLEAERKVAMSRKNIISIITQDIPKGIKNKIIVVESDSNYYGFYSIPPFQTGLGQVLAVNFYQRNDLPSEFLHFPDFSKKGPVSEGYTVFSGIRFGYFHSMSSFYKAQNDLIFSEDELYVFQWLGKENQLINTTNEQRKKYKELKHLRQQTKDWTKNTIGVFSYSYPKYFLIAEQIAEGDNQVRRIKLVSSGQNILISYFSKDKSVFFHEYVHNLIAGDGKVINDRFQVMNVTRSDGSLMTLVKVNSEKGEEYYIPSSTGDSFLVIRNEEGTINSGKSDDIIDTLIKTTFQDI